MGSTFGPEFGYPERACQADLLYGFVTSGGGFSFYNDRPYWQDGAVKEYLENLHHAGGFNRNGRGFPDVSAYAGGFEPVAGGNNYILRNAFSTSVFAAMVSLVNAARLAKGKGPIGFLNIILYMSDGHFFNDITEGDNSCSALAYPPAGPNCCYEIGFQAAKGWDPVTGLGSINFEAFLKYFEKLGEGEKEKHHPRHEDGEEKHHLRSRD